MIPLLSRAEGERMSEPIRYLSRCDKKRVPLRKRQRRQSRRNPIMQIGLLAWLTRLDRSTKRIFGTRIIS